MCKLCNEKELTNDQLQAVSKLSQEIINQGMLIRHLRNGLTAHVVLNSDVSYFLKKGSKVLVNKMKSKHVDLYGGRFEVLSGKTSFEVKGDSIDFLTVEWN